MSLSSLIKNELTKIFKKKSLYITLLVILAFVILTNCMYKFFMNNNMNGYMYTENYEKYMQEELRTLDPTKESDRSLYVELKSQVDAMEIAKQFDEDAWQQQIIHTRLTGLYMEKNKEIYATQKNDTRIQEIDAQINEIVEKFKQDDWRYFAAEELKVAQDKLEEVEASKENVVDRQELSAIDESIATAKLEVEVATLRVNEDIMYGNNYLDAALRNYQRASSELISTEKPYEDMAYEEKVQYQKSLEARELNKHIIDIKQDLNEMGSPRTIISNFFSEYGLFVMVVIIMIAGTIVSEEFNKGTIKLLLVKPFSRRKLLLSKFITVLIMLVFTILAILVMELVVGGILYGFDSLSIPILEYNFNTNAVESINVFAHFGMQVLTQIPMYLLLGTLAFALSTMFTNAPVAIIIPMLGYMGGSIINMMVIEFKVTFMRFFVSMNWDLSGYLYGRLPQMEGMTMTFSIIMCAIYFVAMIIPTFMIFKRKNIKNI